MKRFFLNSLIIFPLIAGMQSVAQNSGRDLREAEARRYMRQQNIQEEAEEEEVGKTFKQKLFTGGSVTLSFGGNFTMLGLNPHFGYSPNNFLDVAVSMNFNYISQRDYAAIGDKVRQTVKAPGLFLRVYPVKFLFAHAQYERNFIRLRYIPTQGEGYIERSGANSFLVGGGLASGREPGSNTFYYISLLWDVGGDRNSPYVDYLGRTLPIFRAGMNIALFQGKGQR